MTHNQEIKQSTKAGHVTLLTGHKLSKTLKWKLYT